MRVVCCSVLLLLMVGCAPKFNGDIIDQEHCDTVQGIMDYAEINKQSPIKKKIYCDFEQKGEMVVESFNTNTQELKKVAVQKNDIEDFKAIFNDALQDQCPECLAVSKEDADIVVKANIIRFVGHVKDSETSGDTSMVFSGEDRDVRFEYQAALSIETDINGKLSSYDHIIDLSSDTKTHVEKMYAVVAASRSTTYTTEFVTKYDSIPLATGATIFNHEIDAYLGVNITKFKSSGYFDIYNLSDMEVKHHLDLPIADEALWWTEEDKDAGKVQALSLYSSGVGSMRYLVFDYIKNLLGEVRDAQ